MKKIILFLLTILSIHSIKTENSHINWHTNMLGVGCGLTVTAVIANKIIKYQQHKKEVETLISDIIEKDYPTDYQLNLADIKNIFAEGITSVRNAKYQLVEIVRILDDAIESCHNAEHRNYLRRLHHRIKSSNAYVNDRFWFKTRKYTAYTLNCMWSLANVKIPVWALVAGAIVYQQHNNS